MEIVVKRRATNRGEHTFGRWGCLTCRNFVANNHTGPCIACGGQIGLLVPDGVRLDLDLVVQQPLARQPVTPVQAPRRALNELALVAAAVMCIGSPLLGASSVGWNAVAVVMALNIWSYSVGYYALALVRQHRYSGEALHA
jgi:hypothetical protein